MSSQATRRTAVVEQNASKSGTSRIGSTTSKTRQSHGQNLRRSTFNHNATVELATLQIDRLVEIAYKEASAICQDLLGILVPTVIIDKPLKLAVMGALSQGHKEPGTTTDNVATNDDNSDGGGKLEDDDLGDEEEDIPEDKINGTECLGVGISFPDRH